FGGTTATVVGALVLATGDLNWPGYYLIAVGVVGVISVWLLTESARRALPGSPPAVATEREGRELLTEGNARSVNGA
ncbi:MAG: hypothetical protein J2P19_16695, partial [Pseudonocardia sp.]|nr:hypothetical protein [Pseudonocardia sp.]